MSHLRIIDYLICSTKQGDSSKLYMWTGYWNVSKYLMRNYALLFLPFVITCQVGSVPYPLPSNETTVNIYLLLISMIFVQGHHFS